MQENIIKRLESEINSAKEPIGEQHNKTRENESRLAEKTRLIQANEATIN